MSQRLPRRISIRGRGPTGGGLVRVATIDQRLGHLGLGDGKAVSNLEFGSFEGLITFKDIYIYLILNPNLKK